MRVLAIFVAGAVGAGTWPLRIVRGEDRGEQAHLASEALRQPTSERAIAPAELLPPPADAPGRAAGGDFPPLPPDPYAEELPPLPPLEAELWQHGGSYLYAPEGDRLGWPHEEEAHYELLRLPETWFEPQPVTMFSEFLGADPVYPRGKWFGPHGYAWDVRFVGAGGYSMFGLALEQNDGRQDAIGHQLLLDLDLQLTGTERFHVQFRPLGEGNTGGSLYQFNDPSGYEDNSTAEPQRYWFEGELASIFGSYVDPFAVRDYNIVAGKFPYVLQNSLLMNDEILGVVLSKNTIYLGPLSNLNVQMFYAPNDVDAFQDAGSQLYGVHSSADYRRMFIETTVAFLENEMDRLRDTQYAAMSVTTAPGKWTVAARGFLKFGDAGGRGGGQLFVLESNTVRSFHQNAFHVEQAVWYCNAFFNTAGWNPISGGNLNRLVLSFETNPLFRLAAGTPPVENWGVACGIQLFRHHQDESLTPEIAFQSPDGSPVIGVGFRYLRKTGPRSFVETLGTYNESSDSRFDRQGIFVSYNILF